ncbi:unnamed protein product [Prorocentrum cordatum]|uniref:Uncharacterized protein n=1 Tax=Prorocentrum cordatum TaxID=2364126 RepID=A0ABN9RJJ8_9DINO|nr:unnamed protein product [Polarella glacialis]
MQAPATPRGAPGKGKGGKETNVKGKGLGNGSDQGKNMRKGKAKRKNSHGAAIGAARCARRGGSTKYIRADMPPCACPGAHIDFASAPGYEGAVLVADSDSDMAKDKSKDNDKYRNTDNIKGSDDVAFSRAWSLGDHVCPHGLRTAALNGESEVMSKLHAGEKCIGVMLSSGNIVAIRMQNLTTSYTLGSLASSAPQASSSPSSSTPSPSRA